MKLIFLGTGTSYGVPVIGCDCEVCQSSDSRDRRFRSSVLVESETTRILVDCGPDARMQLLQQPFRKIDAVCLTHEHYDHTGGLDDLRAFCTFGDIDIYANQKTVDAVRHNYPYCFTEKLYPGVPKFNLHVIEDHEKLSIGDILIMPIHIMHGKLRILGYRFGSLVYITDMKTINFCELEYLRGVKTLVVNALRWENPHHSHMIVSEAQEFAQKLEVENTYFTHLTHQIGLYSEASKRLPQNFHLAYDGLVLDFDE